MFLPLTRFLARLSVGRKLTLIYLLDLSAVIFISGILIHEKFIAIDFARKELAGNSYLAALRTPLLATADGTGAHARFVDPVHDAEARFGTGMESAGLAEDFARALARPASSDSATPGAAAFANGNEALGRGRVLVTRIGNQSNLILDPDLDSYYTMSLVLLRYPELLEVSRDITTQMQAFVASRRPMTAEEQTRYFVLEGRLDTVAKGIDSDSAEAFAASDARLRAALDPDRALLLAGVDRFRHDARAMLEPGTGITELRALMSSDEALLHRLDTVWRQSSDELARLIQLRIDGFFQRMWLHLGTALLMLCVILTAVFTVARHIVLPLRRLSSVAERVARTGDDGARATWDSSDEIGRLVTRFNGMLDQLAVVQRSEKEMAARERAATAQRELVEAVPVPMVVTAIPTHEILHANEPARAWLGDHVCDPWATGLDTATRIRFFQRLSDEGTIDEHEVKWHGGSGSQWAVLSARRVVYQGREAVVTIFTPINRMKTLERRLALWAKVFEASSESIMIVGADRRILSANRALLHATAYDARDVVGATPDILLDEYAEVSFDECLTTAETRGAWQGEIPMRRQDGSAFPAWMIVSTVREGNGPVTHYVCASLDISERKANEERIRWLAHHDVLTALPNRALCVDRLRVAIDDARRDQRRCAVLFIDLDHFKTINDSLGHHIGDSLLRSVAHRLLDVVRAGDTVSRLGGDEFVIVLRDVRDGDEALRTIESRLVPAIRAPHRVGDADLQVSCSVGLAVFPDDGDDGDELMRRADAAMYHAKRSGRDAAQRFSNEFDAHAQRKQQLQTHLRQALERGELSLAYQPKMNAASRALVGVEALLRWRSPELGDVPPAELIPLAEETRLIVPIGAWIVDQAVAQYARWRAEGLGEIPVAVNVSGVQFQNSDFATTVREALRLHGVPASALEIALTESTLMDRFDGTQGQLQQLRSLGVVVSVDDFGTGYSSLTYLNRFPIDRIKIDRSFIRNLLVEPADLAITRAIVGLGHTLGLTVIAEGVESEEVALALADLTCDEVQGYLIARPMTANGFAEWHRAVAPTAHSPRLRVVGGDGQLV
jgi:diguanylate cyclase (GGDEF)-like protein/PAS domain S-box-containing protein